MKVSIALQFIFFFAVLSCSSVSLSGDASLDIGIIREEQRLERFAVDEDHLTVDGCIEELLQLAAPERRELWREILVGKALVSIGDNRGALQAYDRVLKDHTREQLGELAYAFVTRHRARALSKVGKRDESIAILTELATELETWDESELKEQFILAQVALADFLWESNQYELEGAILDKLAEDYAGDEDPFLDLQALYAKMHRAINYEARGEHGATHRMYDEVIAATESGTEPEYRALESWARLSKGILLAKSLRNYEATETFLALQEKFSGDNVPFVSGMVAMGMYNRGVLINDKKEAIAFFDEVIGRYAEHPDPYVQSWAVASILNKSVLLGEIGDVEGRWSGYEEVIERFGGNRKAASLQAVTLALYNQGLLLWEDGKNGPALAKFEEIMRRLPPLERIPEAERDLFTMYREFAKEAIALLEAGKSFDDFD